MRLLTPEGELPATLATPTRRLALAGLFSAGYALAPERALADPITTSSEGLVTQTVTFKAADGFDLPAYVARPAKGGKRSTVIVVNEIFGIHAYIQDVCKRLARAGYNAIAPDYFRRAGDPASLTEMADIRKIVNEAKYPQVMSDTKAAIDFVSTQKWAKKDQFGITGFCWGGTVVWMAAAEFAQIKAGVAWYGRLVASAPQPGAPAPEQRPFPVDIAGKLKSPVLGLYAENDRGIPLDSVRAMEAALRTAGDKTGSKIYVYPGTDHGFHADYRKQYNAEAAANGWSQLLYWLQVNGLKPVKPL